MVIFILNQFYFFYYFFFFSFQVDNDVVNPIEFSAKYKIYVDKSKCVDKPCATLDLFSGSTIDTHKVMFYKRSFFLSSMITLQIKNQNNNKNTHNHTSQQNYFLFSCMTLFLFFKNECLSTAKITSLKLLLFYFIFYFLDYLPSRMCVRDNMSSSTRNDNLLGSPKVRIFMFQKNYQITLDNFMNKFV